ncbi:MAG: AAA family ATPase [Clostridiales bacterium]|nr:AAA family ATPase [Clostridiales bacterium]
MQSELYKKVLEYAFGMSRKDGQTGVDADYFVTALLNIVLADSRGELDGIPEIYIYDKSLIADELSDVRNIFRRYNIDVMDVAVRMEGEVRQTKHDDAFNTEFTKTEYTLRTKLREEGKELTTGDMLEFLLENPSECVKKFIVSAGKKEEPTPQKEEPTPLELAAQETATQGEQAPDEETERERRRQEFEAERERRQKEYEAEHERLKQEAEEQLKLEEEAWRRRREEELRRREESSETDNDYDDQPAFESDGQAPHRPHDEPESEFVLMDHVKRVKEVQDKLLDKVFGQDLAVEMFVSGYFQAELVSALMKKRKKPRATFLFAGPPGVGKTFLAENAAEVLGLPYKRFDMSAYSAHQANEDFAGTDRVYKGSHEGAVTGFVARNPRSILLFDEVEKAHLNVINLFLQILDAGRLRDPFVDKDIDFSDTIIIFTTNAGKKLYEDPDIINLSGVPKKTVVRALATDMRADGTPYFPEAMCSRLASGNVIMFNRLEAHDLLRIVGSGIAEHAAALESKTGVKIETNGDINYAVLYSEGGRADARSIRGKAVNFFYNELYEFYRLISSDKNGGEFDTIRFGVELPEDEKIKALFTPAENPEVLIFADEDVQDKCGEQLNLATHFASDMETAKNIIAENEISVILCDVKCGLRKGRQDVLNLEDIDSVGRDFFNYISQNVNTPLYVLGGNYDITGEELLSFSRNGAMGIIKLDDGDFCAQVTEKCNIAKQQRNLMDLARARKILSYQTAQSVDGGVAHVTLFDLKLSTAVEAEDSDNILSDMSRPDLKFDDVIGAENAKKELGFFTEFLKNPKKFAKNGVRPPKGILLYGPPGTGKTLLAKALAGESEVTFIAVEGNKFLRKYVGEGSQLVHDLFAAARKYAPAVLFIDEIDAIGISRAELSAENDHTGDTLTAFLTEMDGFKTHPDRPVFVLAATNVGVDDGGKKQLDPALLRRFDRRIEVDLPNRQEREQFLRMQVDRNTNLTLSESQIKNIAMRSTGMSLADLASVVEMALRSALNQPDFAVTDESFEEAFEEYNSGEVKKWNDETLLRTARHECGHALMCWLSGETPSYLTIVARDNHGGYMQHGDREDKQIYTKADMLALIRTALGGRAAELVYYGEEDGVSTGPSGDLQNATARAEQLICYYGMDEKLGLGVIDPAKIALTPYYSVLRERINEILKEQLDIAKKTISDNKMAVDELVRRLLDSNKLNGEQIDQILDTFIKR